MLANNSTKLFKISEAIKRSFAKFVLLVSIFFFANKIVAQEMKPGIFYAVTGNGLKDTSWLFGTYHLVASSYLNDVPKVKEAFSKAKGVVVETIIDSSKLQAAQEYGISKDQQLTDLLDKPFLDSLDEELKKNIGAGIEQINQLKPVNVTLTLSMLYLVRNNSAQLKKYNGLPLDAFFAGTGRESGKTVTPLEDLFEQMELLFNQSSMEQQAQGLKAFLRNKNVMLKLGDQLMQSWFDHDLNAMNMIYTKTMALSGEEDYLVKGRNIRWMKVIPGLIKKEAQFIAVGALHLAGEFGLVEQLKQMGYTVIPVKL